MIVDGNKNVISDAKLSDKAVIVDTDGNRIVGQDIKCVVRDASDKEVNDMNKSFADNNVVINENSSVEYYDIKLMNNNVVVKLESGKVTITFSKKADVDYNKVDVYVYHLKDDGTLEILNPIVTDKGIVIEAESFSPYAVVTVPKVTSDNNQNGNNNSDSNNNATESNAGNNANAGANENVNANTNTDTNTNTDAGTETVQSGDSNNSMMYYIIAIMAVIAAGAVIISSKKKKQIK